jgi:hypothetical protein
MKMNNNAANIRENLINRASDLLEKLSYPTELLAYVRDWMEGRRENGDLLDRLDNEERRAA